MAAVTIQFVGNDSIGSKLIEWFDHGLYSHVDTVLPDGSLLGARDDVIDGIPAGVQIRPADYIKSYPRVLRVELPMSDILVQKYYDFVHAQIGKAYDQTAIAAFVSGRNWRDGDKWFCSELVSAGLEICSYVGKLSAPVNKIAPDDLLLVCSALVDI